jgi:hypothetical protein
VAIQVQPSQHRKKALITGVTGQDCRDGRVKEAIKEMVLAGKKEKHHFSCCE